MAKTYIVKKGDTLSEIAVDNYKELGFSTWKQYQDHLANINNLDDPDFIVTGQTLKLEGTKETPKVVASTVTIKQFGMLSSIDKLFVSWEWNRKKDTEGYQVRWTYLVKGTKQTLVASDTTTEEMYSTQDIPAGAYRVYVKVKPVPKKVKDAPAYTAKWTAAKGYWNRETIAAPSVPTIDITSRTYLQTSVNNTPEGAVKIRFEVVEDDKKVARTLLSVVKTRQASATAILDVGHRYKVRCRAEDGDYYSEWSDYSENVYSAPSTPKNGITAIEAKSETDVFIKWGASTNATAYELEYSTDKTYFAGSNLTTTVSLGNVVQHLLGNLQTGKEYFFRVRGVRDNQYSAWSSIKSVVLGKNPIAPTTWSSTTKAIIGERVTLFWVHNSEDGSKETYAKIELITTASDGTQTSNEIDISNPNSGDDDEVLTRSYVLGTDIQVVPGELLWRVRTAGITNNYGDWSVQRSIDFYEQPSLSLSARNSSGNAVSSLTEFPLYISAIPHPEAQTPIGYYVEIVPTSTYETSDDMGNTQYVQEGDKVYSKYFDVNTDLVISITASDIHLENNIEYEVRCTVSLDSGLTAEASTTFLVAFDTDYIIPEPDASLILDPDSVSMAICPMCTDEDILVEDVMLSVYRREFDGSFTEIASDLTNDGVTYVTDPHPALDFARYRIIATHTPTGKSTFCDIAPYPVSEKAVIIQWEEAWSSFEVVEEGYYEEPSWSGSLLRLPYNIDASESNDKDVQMVEYIGRKHPVGYYGTQLGEVGTWNVDVPKEDAETLYSLRRLQKWMGDVYVRNPSGVGYWASIEVSFSQKHTEVTVPVTLNITRVEGGI